MNADPDAAARVGRRPDGYDPHDNAIRTERTYNQPARMWAMSSYTALCFLSFP